MVRKSFFQGAVVLGIAGVIVKVFGAFFRIPLGNIIGDTGMGYYQTAYPVYVLLLTLSTAGIPTAIARLVSERVTQGKNREAYRVFRLSFLLLLVLGVGTSAILFFGAPFIIRMMKGPQEAVYSMRAIAPALLFVPMMASLRGYFQGRQDMKPTAISQVVEQLFRVICGLSLSVLLLPMGLKYAAAGASSGAAIGGMFGLLAIFIVFTRRKGAIRAEFSDSETNHEPEESSGAILRKIVFIAVPVTIGAAIMPIMTNIDLALVVRRLVDAGFTSAEANSLYGQLSGFATPLINLPQVLTQAIAVSLVPAVAASFSSKDREFLQYNTSFGIRTAMLIGMPCSIGLMVLSKPIMLLLYPKQQESAESAAASLFILAFGAIFLALVQTLTGVLQGVGKQMIPVVSLAIGAVIKVVITYVFTGVAWINVKGAAVGTVAAYITASVLNLIAVRKYTGCKLEFVSNYGKPLACSLIMGAVVAAVYRVCGLILGNGLSEQVPASFFDNAVATVISVGCGVVVYMILILALRVITPEEIEQLPGGRKLVKILRLNRRKD